MKKITLFLLITILANHGIVYAEEFKEIVPIEQRIIENAKKDLSVSNNIKRPEKIDDTIQEPKTQKEENKQVDTQKQTTTSKAQSNDLTKNNFFQDKPQITKDQFTGRVLDLAQKKVGNGGVVFANDETTPYTGKFALFLGDFIEYTETYKDGILEGPKTWYSENGNVVLEETYKDNKIEGPQKAYYENGKIKSVVDYKNNKIVGITAYSKDGKILHQDNFKNGTGKWKYFWSNGNILEEGQYKHWVKDGVWKKYREDGQLDSVTEYKNGKLVETTWN